ncbi:glycosyltransferase [Eggerthella sinensis]|uniref:Glycosyl transferase family 1 domain-containing protein n=1 Tax=Eggerthella sinensis TaxID=242230 RepID=A0A3N0IWK7_9ACTN|nr:glycosyltransferase [Eggerthella sinensis]MCB7039415.1 glycosyltransferase [Eggerthella sinensis]RDB65385.1 hypothetical protein C1876_15915 [Eggerthella sinensis]RNM41381.1 hypothetical protein DMP09_09890 [Eggerthella sinensis]
MKKALYYIGPSFLGGGAERVIASISEFLVKHDIEVCIVVTKQRRVQYEIPTGVQMVEKYAQEDISPFQQIRVIRSLMKAHPEATFLSFLPHQNLYTLLAKTGLTNRVIVSVRNDPRHDFENSRLLPMLRDCLYKYADVIVFQTEDEAACFPRHVRDKGELIWNPLSQATPSPYFGPREKRVVSVGRLASQKNYPMALLAFAQFHKIHPDYTYEIFGEGFGSASQEEPLKQLVHELGLEQSVVFRGFSSEVNERVRTSAMFVMASRFEGLSNSMLEALSMGVPSICTRCDGGGAESVINDGINGFLVDVNDVEMMSKCMCRIVEEEELAASFSREAAKIRAQIDINVIGEKWLSILWGNNDR